MITGRSPWAKAATSDDYFVNFLLNENCFYETLPISKEANVLLRKIFTCEPSERITLSALRKEIIALETFYMTNAEIARAGAFVREAAAYCGVHVTPRSATTTSEGEPPAQNKAVAGAAQRTPSDSPAQRSDDLPAALSGSTVESSRPSSSDGDSEGPVTPASYPEDDELNDFSELKMQLEGLEISGMLKEEKMPRAPRIVQIAKAFWQ